MKKTVLITGASRGIGKACAIIFSMHGYNIAVNYNKSRDAADKLVEMIKSNGGNAVAYHADVADCNAVNKMVTQVASDFGGIYALINNAGVCLNKMFTDVSPDEWQKLSATNIDGSVYCAQAVLPYMASQKCGRIINMSSIWGVNGASCEVHYSVTKAAIIGLTKALSKEYGSCGITVNCIAPGAIDTDMMKGFDDCEKQKICDRTSAGRLGTVSDVANTALFLADRTSDFITGQVLGVDGGFI